MFINLKNKLSIFIRFPIQLVTTTIKHSFISTYFEGTIFSELKITSKQTNDSVDNKALKLFASPKKMQNPYSIFTKKHSNRLFPETI